MKFPKKPPHKGQKPPPVGKPAKAGEDPQTYGYAGLS